jgi:hypothetical protein
MAVAEARHLVLVAPVQLIARGQHDTVDLAHGPARQAPHGYFRPLPAYTDARETSNKDNQQGEIELRQNHNSQRYLGRSRQHADNTQPKASC